jgi:phosphoglycolate phosphatase-like HAD superfamily hydrolase
MKNIKCIIFDFDDTIILSEKMKLEKFYEISKSFGNIGIEFYDENINKKLTRFEYFEKFSNYLYIFYLQQMITIIYDFTSETMIKKFKNQVSHSLKECVELPNIRKYIEHHFNKNYKLYISSKSNKDDIINTLKHKKLYHYFDGISGSETSKIEYFKEIMSIDNIQPNEILFFGDSKSDYDVATEMNTNFIGVLTGRDDLKYIDCKKIKDYNELI